MDVKPQAQNRVSPKQQILEAYSLEMTAKELNSLETACPVIPAGTSIFVPFLPGEDPERRLAAAVAIKRLGFAPVPHISARRIASVEELELSLARLASEAGIDRAFIIAGDRPEPIGPYPDALAIIQSGLLARYGIVRVGISGYPEGHPQIPTPLLWQALRDKSVAIKAAGQTCEIVTQFGFDADPILIWLKELRAQGISALVRVGLPGPASVKTLLRFAARCGVGASTKIIAKYGMSITRLMSATGPDNLLKELAVRLDTALHNEVRIHLYPFGGLKAAAEWAREFSV
jgi:methylenetetrahydrofolate reductase (NADPH)